jgi:SulP family sulfate permease
MASRVDAWLPKSVILLRNYDRQKFLHDLTAGITVGLVALPLAMAFAIASGLPPQNGLYCAIVTGFIISALGGSKTQIGGPTGAFVVVVAGIVAKYGIEGLFLCTMMAGVLLVILGLTGMGTAVKYFPRPVVTGFTNGIAILIASTQIKDFFGLHLDHFPSDFFHRMAALAHAFPTLNWTAATVALVSLAVMILCLNTPSASLARFSSVSVRLPLSLSFTSVSKRSALASAASRRGCPTSSYPNFTTIRPANFSLPL